MNPDAVVPNAMPTTDPGSVRLACVGEAPAVEECSWRHCISQGHGYAGEHWQNRERVTRDRCPLCGSQQWAERPTPFVGESGRLLNDLLRDVGLPRERCWVGNVSRHPLREGEKTLEHCKGGLSRLAYDLSQFRPNCVLVLGNLALAAFIGEGHSVTAWRGSIVQGGVGDFGCKVVVGVHPAAILREPSQLALLRHDVARAVAEAAHPGLDVPQHVVDAPSDPDEVIAKLRAMQAVQQPVGHDIEGGCDVGVTVCSFADSPTHALSIPFKRMNWTDVWSKSAAEAILSAIQAIHADPGVPKVMHSGMYELFAWRWLHGFQVRNVHDSMLAFHVLLPEIDKALDVVASLYTRQPYWGTTKDWTCDADRDLYNCIDSCVCLEAFQAILYEMTPRDDMKPHERELAIARLAYYRHQVALLEPCLEMSYVGLRYDSDKRDAMVAALEREVWTLGGELDSLAGIPLPSFADVREAVAMKVKWAKCSDWPDLLTFAKPSMKEAL
jgi:uracil-DNA glycosylase family 4